MMDPDWAAAFPTDDGLTFFAAMPTKERLPEFKADPEAALVDYFEAVPEAPSLRSARGSTSAASLGKIDMTNRMRTPTAPGLALIGDAALATDPLFGVGCGWAFQSAEWLADAVAPALRGEEALEKGLRRYRRTHSRHLRGHAWMIHDYATGRKLQPAGAAALLRRARATRGRRRSSTPSGRGRSARRRLIAVGMPLALAANARYALRHARCAEPRRRTVERRASGAPPDGDRGDERAVRRRRFDAAGTSSRLVEAGPEEASTAVVFLHGNPGSCDDWEPLVGAVGATGKRALAFDLPDFGETIAAGRLRAHGARLRGLRRRGAGGARGRARPPRRCTTSAGRSASPGSPATPTDWRP